MKILAFAASSSRQSINKQLVTYASTLSIGNEVEVIDLNDYELPIFSQDKENDIGHPQLAIDYMDKIASSDGIIISFAEHNGSYTAAYKNIFDWASRIDQKVFQNKPMVLLATSPGPGGASNVLNTATTSAPYFAGNVKASLSIPSFYDNFNSEKGELINEKITVELTKAVNDLFSIKEINFAIAT